MLLTCRCGECRKVFSIWEVEERFAASTRKQAGTTKTWVYRSDMTVTNSVWVHLTILGRQRLLSQGGLCQRVFSFCFCLCATNCSTGPTWYHRTAATPYFKACTCHGSAEQRCHKHVQHPPHCQSFPGIGFCLVPESMQHTFYVCYPTIRLCTLNCPLKTGLTPL